MRNQKSEIRKLPVKRYFVVSVVGTLRAASVFDTSLSTLILCVRKQNIRVVIYLTQRAQRARSLYFPAIHAVAGVDASFTATRERRGRGD